MKAFRVCRLTAPARARVAAVMRVTRGPLAIAIAIAVARALAALSSASGRDRSRARQTR